MDGVDIRIELKIGSPWDVITNQVTHMQTVKGQPTKDPRNLVDCAGQLACSEAVSGLLDDS
eukprot:scaffold18965_cov33-Tisochrysis_lutea.AAC.2